MERLTASQLAKSLETLYTEGNFTAARELLVQHKSAFAAGQFHYNLGTLYAREGELAAGRYHLEQALSGNFVNPLSLNNLETVVRQLEVRDLSQSHRLYDRLVDTGLLIPASAYLTISLVLFLALWALVRGKIVRALSIKVALVALGLSPLAWSQLHLRTIKRAIVLRDTPVYEGPSKIYTPGGTIQGGAKIIVGKNHNGWRLIEHPLSLSGWVQQENLGLY